VSGFRPLLVKELRALFLAPLAWWVMAIYLLLTGYAFSTWLIVGQTVSLARVTSQSAMLLVLFVPLITMRAFAEERQRRTLELLLATPVDEVALVGAKFCAGLSVCLLMLLPTVIYPWVLSRFGQPDWGPVYGGYLGLLLLSMTLNAVGIAFSAWSSNQIVAAIASLGFGLTLWALEALARLLPDPFDVVLVNTSLVAHFTPMSIGIVYLSDLGYFLTLTGLGLLFALRGLGRP
jgi:ABC-2 type transport system permease protein